MFAAVIISNLLCKTVAIAQRRLQAAVTWKCSFTKISSRKMLVLEWQEWFCFTSCQGWKEEEEWDGVIITGQVFPPVLFAVSLSLSVFPFSTWQDGLQGDLSITVATVACTNTHVHSHDGCARVSRNIWVRIQHKHGRQRWGDKLKLQVSGLLLHCYYNNQNIKM